MLSALIAFLLLPQTSCTDTLKPAFLALQQKAPLQASAILEANREQCAETSYYSELLGTTNELLGNAAAATAAFQKAVSVEPKNARLRFELGASYVESGNPQEAIRQLKLGLDIDPASVAGRKYLIGLYVSLKDWQSASQQFENLGAFNGSEPPKDPALLLWLAQVLVETKKSDRIDSLILPKLAEMPPALLFSLGGLFASHRMYSDVVQCLSHISEQDADDAVYFNLGDAYSHLQQFDKARVSYFRTIDKHAGHVEAYLHVGLDFISSGRPREGVPWLAQAHKLAANRVDIAYALAEQLIDLQYLDTAAQILKEAAIDHPDDALVLVALGDLKVAGGEQNEAIELYQNALAKQPKLPQALVSLARVDISQEKYDDAKQALESALSTDPGNAAAESAMGNLYAKKGLWDSASTYLLKAWNQNHANIHIALELGRAYQRAGRLSDALRLLSSVKSEAQDSPAYHLELSQLYAQTHRAEESKAELDTFNTLQKADELSLRFESARTYVF